MATEEPPHGLYIKWGRLHIGASGVPALATIAFAVLMAFIGRMLGAW